MNLEKTRRAVAGEEGSKRNKVLVNFILDKSGSMATTREETIRGFNSYLAELKTEKAVDYLFSLTMFDTAFEIVHAAALLEEVKDLTAKSYQPGGMTALYDAICSTVRKIESDVDPMDKVITIIYTDGEENSSREYSYDQVRQLVKEKEGLGNWTFVYLGAVPKAVNVGMSLGVAAANAYRYAPNQTSAVYGAMGQSTNLFARSGSLRATNFVPQNFRRGPSGQSIVGVDDEDDLDANTTLNPTSSSDNTTTNSSDPNSK